MLLILLLGVILALSDVMATSSHVVNRARDTTVVWVTVTLTNLPQASAAPSHPDEATQPPQTSQAEDSSFDYIQAVLGAHNSHRDNHSAPALTWSYELAGIAHNIGKSCYYQHNTEMGGGGYGQNIGAGASPQDSPAMISNLMYNGEFDLYPGYDAEPGMDSFEEWGHFSQIIWNETQEVGCATIHCPGGLGNTAKNVAPWFLVCNFRPAGKQLSWVASDEG